MKTIGALILLVSSWRSVHGCQLASCTGMSFDVCPGWTDQNCRKQTTLSLAGKGLFGPIPASFYQLYGTQINGDAAAGIEKVELTKVDLQDNSLVGVFSHILDCPTVKEVNLKGNAVGSEQTINTNADGLESLNMDGTSQTHVKWLINKAPNLKILHLANNQISDISPITQKTKLTTLDLSGNPLITDLTALASLTALTTLIVDPALQQQATILTSGGTPETKRSQLIAASIGDIKAVAAGNADTIQQLTASMSTGMQAMTNTNQGLAARVAALEAKLAQLNSACLVDDGGYTQPIAGDAGDTGGYSNPEPENSNPLDINVGGRRLQGTGCLPVVGSSATATGIASAVAITAGAMFL